MNLTNDILLPYTKAKNQNGTASCWAFSMCSYWETENAIAEGDEVPVVEYSPWYYAHQKIEDFCKRKMKGGFRNALRPLPVGAMAQTAIKINHDNGAVYLKDYNLTIEVTNQYRLMSRIIRVLSTIGQALPFLSSLMLKCIAFTLNARWGKLPKQTVNTICSDPKDFRHYTSFAHMPLGQDVRLNLPDNLEGWTFHNISLEAMMSTMLATLQEGHSLVWQGCVRRGFSMKRGIALAPKNKSISEEERVKDFNNGILTDDHMMHIIGLAHDDDNTIYFIAKNSVGEVGPYHGLVYMHEDFVRMNTIAITVGK